MNTQKRLPCRLPIFSSYHYQICGMIPALINPDGYNWYINECVQLSCSDTFFSEYDADGLMIDNSSFTENPNLDVVTVDKIGSWDDVISGIENAINDDRYVYFCGADDYFIREKSNFGKAHMSHDGLIYGCDGQTEELFVLAYNKDWVCKSFTVSFGSFRDSLHNILDGANKWYGFFSYIKAKKDRIPIDLFAIRNSLREYLDSDLKKYPYESPGKKSGMVVYDYLRLLFGLACDGYFPDGPDRRLMRVLWEHKKCMRDRIKAVSGLIGTSESLCSDYEKAVEAANRARMIFARCCLCGDMGLLRSVSEQLTALQNMERELLEAFEAELSKALRGL